MRDGQGSVSPIGGRIWRVISFFNNKGGVGKTTLSCNLAASLSQAHGQRVLYLDCDPQCNLTLLILGEERIEDIYWNTKGVGSSGCKTIIDIVHPMELGDSDIDTGIVPQLRSENRFSVDLIPGHPRLSVVEDRLGEAWNTTLAGDIGAIRKTNWCAALVDHLAKAYDYILIIWDPA